MVVGLAADLFIFTKVQKNQIHSNEAAAVVVVVDKQARKETNWRQI
jgi:hypothetical protein